MNGKFGLVLILSGVIGSTCDIQTGIFVNFVFLFTTLFILTLFSVLSCFSFVDLAFVFCSPTPAWCMGLLWNLIYRARNFDTPYTASESIDRRNLGVKSYS